MFNVNDDVMFDNNNNPIRTTSVNANTANNTPIVAVNAAAAAGPFINVNDDINVDS